jgi:hypothetical protein
MNIFYTEVDKNLREELNARGRAGFQSRTTKDLDFMLGKIANVQLTAFAGNGSDTAVVSILGGSTVQGGRYLPSGPDGYLTNKVITDQTLDFYTETDVAMNELTRLLGKLPDKNVIAGNAYLKDTPIYDRVRRPGPYVTGIDIAIGDHSMGLLNKATINISIPNVTRDLDNVEEVWFRPGRYVAIDIVHPDSAVITRTVNTTNGEVTGGYLTEKTLPRKDRIKELYPKWDVDEFLKKISKMNVFNFEGLITSFDFSYTADGTVEATLSLTGTSNVYTDVSMYLSGDQKTEKKSTPGDNTQNFTIQPVITTTPPVAGEEATTEPQQLWQVIQSRVEATVRKFKEYSDATKKFQQFLLPYSSKGGYTPATDHFLLVGEQWLPKIKQEQIPEAKNEYKYGGAIKNKIIRVSKLDKTERSKALTPITSGSVPVDPASIPDASTLINPFTGATGLSTLSPTSTIDEVDQVVQILSFNGLITDAENTEFTNDLARARKEEAEAQARADKQNAKRSEFIENFNKGEGQSNYNRYITLGALIHEINNYVVSNISGSVKVAEIVHTDVLNFSNYYPLLVSTNPEDVLFLPKDPSVINDMNSYAATLEDVLNGTSLIYYKDVVNQITRYGLTENALFESNYKEWPGVYEKQGNVGKMYPSRIFINLETVQRVIESLTKQKNGYTVKAFISKISEIVSRCSGNAIDLKLVTYPDDPSKLMLSDSKYLKSTNETVIPYSVPMFANHPHGSVVREFSFAAKLPENVKNLSYVLNQGDNVTEEQIAPYMNFMYNAKNATEVNKALATYRIKYSENIKRLVQAKRNYGLSPGITERKQALYKAVTDYIKFPTDDIKSSQQITAPIFPFEAEFTIDGINGLRYGDVLTFEALPSKYRINTVFSVIGITHTVSTEGDWTTKVKCIMRPSIE